MKAGLQLPAFKVDGARRIRSAPLEIVGREIVPAVAELRAA